jgi:peroxiredoxin
LNIQSLAPNVELRPHPKNATTLETDMKKIALAAGLSLALAAPAFAALAPGATAPEFDAPAYLAGKPFNFDLDAALKKGPVVLYFFPAAHTSGCNLEAHLFADAADQFKAQGATLIGITAGHVDQLAAFSTETEHCSGKFPVAADTDAKIAKSYQSTLALMPGLSDRTSYVIAPDHKVIFTYSALDPNKHVDQTLDALKKWRASHPA